MTTSFRSSHPGAARSGREPVREVAAAVDEVGEAIAPERAQSGVDGEARAPGGTTRASSRPRRGPTSPGPRGTTAFIVIARVVRAGLRAEHQPAVVRDVEPLVPSVAHESACVDAVDEVAARRAGGGPEPEGAVDVEPGVRLADDLDDLDEGVVRAVLTSPACAQTIVGPSIVAERGPEPGGLACGPARRPGRPRSAQLPIPRSRRARSTVTWRSPPTTTVIGGEPASPPLADVPPVLEEHVVPRGREAVTCAIWQPVVMANEASAGRPKRSLSQSPVISSTTIADGPSAPSPAHWSQIVVSQSAPTVAGSAPPVTYPK